MKQKYLKATYNTSITHIMQKKTKIKWGERLKPLIILGFSKLF